MIRYSEKNEQLKEVNFEREVGYDFSKETQKTDKKAKGSN